MRLVEEFIALYGIVIIVSALLLVAAGVQQIEVYYAVYLVEYLVAVELVGSFRRSLERTLRPVIVMFVLGFVFVVAQRILQLLG